MTGSMLALDTLEETENPSSQRVSPDVSGEVEMKKMVDRQRKLEDELSKSQSIIIALKELLKRSEKSLETERDNSSHIRTEYDKLKTYLEEGR